MKALKRKEGIQGTKWKDPHPRKQKNHQREQATRQHQVPKRVARNISNNETEGLLKGRLT
jgi:hypothetical protein